MDFSFPERCTWSITTPRYVNNAHADRARVRIVPDIHLPDFILALFRKNKYVNESQGTVNRDKINADWKHFK